MKLKTLPLKNLIKKPFRTGALILIAALMTIALFGGSVASASMKNGLDSLEQRLGADIIVVPEEAEAKVELENILLQGTPGYFYMDKSLEEQIAAIEGVELTSPQYFLVSANAECCSVQVQNEIIVGSSLSTKVGHTLKLYGVDCKAVGKLDATGTGLDTAIYTTPDTVRTLIKASQEKGIGVLSKQNPDDVISSVYVKVREGYDISEVAGAINLQVDGVEAVRTRSMITGTADRLSAISGSIGIIRNAVWILAAVLMTAAFSVLAGVRRREFAILRTIGFSRRQLSAEVFSESSLICAGGIIAGILLTAVTVFPFGSLIEQRTGLPYLSPDLLSNVRYAVLTAAAVLLTGVISSAYSAYRLSRADTGNILREGD